MIKKISLCFITILCMFTIGGCSTIVNGTQQSVAIRTVPSNADITVDGQLLKSPTSVQLPGKSAGYVVTASKKGYQTTTGKINSSFRGLPTILGNILWLVPGLIVDFITGAAFELQPQVTIPLQKK